MSMTVAFMQEAAEVENRLWLRHSDKGDLVVSSQLRDPISSAIAA
jgi:hypothetical protein